jgi:hypothetical protein
MQSMLACMVLAGNLEVGPVDSKDAERVHELSHFAV